jgi:hypothetical protein
VVSHIEIVDTSAARQQHEDHLRELAARDSELQTQRETYECQLTDLRSASANLESVGEQLAEKDKLIHDLKEKFRLFMQKIQNERAEQQAKEKERVEVRH